MQRESVYKYLLFNLVRAKTIVVKSISFVSVTSRTKLPQLYKNIHDLECGFIVLPSAGSNSKS